MKLDREVVIEAVSASDFDTFIAYLNEQMLENGSMEVGYFQPMSRHCRTVPGEKVEAFRTGLETPLCEPGWRRAWVAWRHREVVGHVDLRARPEPFTSHRCLLGLGVHRAHRRDGIGLRLVEFAAAWALRNTEFEWIDLGVLSANDAAIRLYEKAGFVNTGELPDLFRIDGESLSERTMAKRLLRHRAG